MKVYDFSVGATKYDHSFYLMTLRQPEYKAMQNYSTAVYSIFTGKITMGNTNLKNRFWKENIVWLCKNCDE